MASSSDKSESADSLLTTVEKCVECPVCLETAKVPFKLCSRGHIVCLSCTTKLSKCPTCEGLFRPTEDNPVCLKNILEALPRCCIYSQDGCEEIVEPGNDDHEEFCGYRPIVCRALDCSVEMPVVKVLDHYKEHHVNGNIITESYVEGLPLPTFAYTPVWLFQHLFWILRYIYTQTDLTDQLRIYFLVTPIGKLDQDYYLRVTMENGDFVVTNTVKATVMSCEKGPTLLEYGRGEMGLTDENERFFANIPLWQLNTSLDEIRREVTFKFFFYNKEKK